MRRIRYPRTAGYLLLVCLLPGARASAQERPMWGNLEPGDHEVGFRRIWDLDPSRVWPRSPALDSLEGPVARPLRIDLWYPARCPDAGRMPLGGYLDMKAPAPQFDDLVFLTHRWDEYSYRGLAGDSTSFDRLMAYPTAACADAPAASDRFPLVVYSAGWFNRAPDNTVLAEFLASHGFVVAAVPQLNPGLWTFSFRSDAVSVENQVRDLEMAVAIGARLPVVDRRHVAAMGYSTGGDVALLLEDRNPLIDVVVGLDASWTLGPGNDVVESPLFDPTRVTGPVLAVRRKSDPGDTYDAVLDSLTSAPRMVVDVAGGEHGSFSDDPGQRYLLGTGSAEEREINRVIAESVLAFLQATLKGRGGIDADALLPVLRGPYTDVRFRPPRH